MHTIKRKSDGMTFELFQEKICDEGLTVTEIIKECQSFDLPVSNEGVPVDELPLSFANTEDIKSYYGLYYGVLKDVLISLKGRIDTLSFEDVITFCRFLEKKHCVLDSTTEFQFYWDLAITAIDRKALRDPRSVLDYNDPSLNQDFMQCVSLVVNFLNDTIKKFSDDSDPDVQIFYEKKRSLEYILCKRLQNPEDSLRHLHPEQLKDLGNISKSSDFQNAINEALSRYPESGI